MVSTTCSTGYYLSSGACVACGTGASSCSSASVATACSTGYFLASGSCTACSTGVAACSSLTA